MVESSRTFFWRRPGDWTEAGPACSGMGDGSRVDEAWQTRGVPMYERSLEMNTHRGINKNGKYYYIIIFRFRIYVLSFIFYLSRKGVGHVTVTTLNHSIRARAIY